MNQLTGMPAIQGMDLAPNPAPMPPPQPTPKEIADTHNNFEQMMGSLLSLTSRPEGKLSKKDVYSATADLMAKGMFPTPQAKAAVIGEIAKLPEDEAGIRQALGAHLMSLGDMHQQVGQVYPKPMAPAAPAAPQAPVMTNG